VRGLLRSPLFRLLASLKLTMAILIVFAVASGKATIIESSHGADAARDLVYNARWFEALLALFVLNLLAVLVDRYPYKPRQTGFVVTHVAMIVILVSAGITRYFGYEGSMHIREGQRSGTILTRDTYLQLRLGEETATSLVRLWRSGHQHLARKLKLGGTTYRAVITDYWPHYEIRIRPADSGPAALGLVVTTGKGMQRVTLVDGEARRVGGRTLLFRDGPLPAPDARERRLLFGRDATGGVTARIPFDLQRVGMDDGEADTVLAHGNSFPVEEMTLYREPAGRFSFVVREILEHVRRVPGPSDNPRAPGAARVEVTSPAGKTASIVVEDGDTDGRTVQLGDERLTVAVAPLVIELPYELHLDDFVLQKYPGSNNPASYESWVRIYDPGLGIDGKPFHIYMNHPLSHRGSKHFQSSYDVDEKGTILSVNHDPGKWPTYIGYILISLGFILIFARDLLWPERPVAGKGGRS